MAVEISPNTSTTRNTNVSVESPDTSAMKPGGTDEQKIEHLANEGAERAAKRINDDKGNVPGTSEFTK
jgi:hypothetical protein